MKFAAVSLNVRQREPVLRHRTAEEGHDCETLNQLGKLLFSKALVLFNPSSGTKTSSLELLVSRPASSILYVILCSVAQLNLLLQKNFNQGLPSMLCSIGVYANLSMQDVPTELDGSNLAQGK